MTNTVINLITKNKLLQYRVNRLTKALYNEKRKRQQGKPLFTCLAPPEQSKTTFTALGRFGKFKSFKLSKSRLNTKNRLLKLRRSFNGKPKRKRRGA